MKTQKNQGHSTRKVVVLPEEPYSESHIIYCSTNRAPLGNGSYAKASTYSKYGY